MVCVDPAPTKVPFGPHNSPSTASRTVLAVVLAYEYQLLMHRPTSYNKLNLGRGCGFADLEASAIYHLHPRRFCTGDYLSFSRLHKTGFTLDCASWPFLGSKGPRGFDYNEPRCSRCGSNSYIELACSLLSGRCQY